MKIDNAVNEKEMRTKQVQQLMNNVKGGKW